MTNQAIGFSNPKPDEFQSGALITNENREIVYANTYFSDELNWTLKKLLGQSSDVLFTISSKIFCESYLMPLLIHEKKCEEMQLTLFDGNGKRVPVIVSAKMDEKSCIYWSFFNASKRDKLYEELIDARKELEAQAKTLKLMASTDELTGLMNRRELNLRAPEVINQAKRYTHNIALLMIDIDHFKKINDAHGHLEGDRVLKALGQKLLKFGRQTDLIARFGGEEFIMLLPDTNTSNAKIFARRLHQLTSGIEVNHAPVTVSIGITMTDGSHSLDDLTNQADGALYEAKKNGRNKTEFYKET
ncbi:sensor domain-containing diguanylate cyclase [Paraglaciecola psychrophila]|uniref:diguanylate cyclase n=1 Tax=Paraglaciecola psychrophila 170 TaxID=1129794 RepID=K7AHL0_9ALTE|nr:diguanylate cyclase [Paraglaciecola psychrophila]AGH42884.1 diguanylate cyclase [Paraglaciecola psychrophila 170]GAC40088.1 diguanylate cyclase (GGDEF domain) with PAS/PAC sensor [Paraglaciecola psychrophila 170]